MIIITIVVVIVACALIALKFGVISSANNNAEASISNASSRLMTLTSGINTDVATPSLTNDQKVAKLQQYLNDLKGLQVTICRDQRGQLYYDVLPAHNTCQKAYSTFGDITTSVSAIYAYIADETVLSSLLPKGNASTSFSDTYDLWNRTSSLVSAAKVGQEARGIKTSLQSTVDSYRDAWKALADANTKQDSAAFSKASDAVKSAYVLLQSQANESKTELDALDAIFSAKYATFILIAKA